MCELPPELRDQRTGFLALLLLGLLPYKPVHAPTEQANGAGHYGYRENGEFGA
jgi:hypothetical protein